MIILLKTNNKEDFINLNDFYGICKNETTEKRSKFIDYFQNSNLFKKNFFKDKRINNKNIRKGLLCYKFKEDEDTNSEDEK